MNKRLIDLDYLKVDKKHFADRSRELENMVNRKSDIEEVEKIMTKNL